MRRRARFSGRRLTPPAESIRGRWCGERRCLWFVPLDALGHMYGLDAATGPITGNLPAAVHEFGRSDSNGVVYWGSRYSNFGLGAPDNKFFAFGLP